MAAKMHHGCISYVKGRINKCQIFFEKKVDFFVCNQLNKLRDASGVRCKERERERRKMFIPATFSPSPSFMCATVEP